MVPLHWKGMLEFGEIIEPIWRVYEDVVEILHHFQVHKKNPVPLVPEALRVLQILSRGVQYIFTNAGISFTGSVCIPERNDVPFIV